MKKTKPKIFKLFPALPITEPERDCVRGEGGAAPWDRPGLMGLEKSRGGNRYGPHTQTANAGADQSGAGVSERVDIETYFVGDKVIINTTRGERDTTNTTMRYRQISDKHCQAVNLRTQNKATTDKRLTTTTPRRATGSFRTCGPPSDRSGNAPQWPADFSQYAHKK